MTSLDQNCILDPRSCSTALDRNRLDLELDVPAFPLRDNFHALDRRKQASGQAAPPVPARLRTPVNNFE